MELTIRIPDELGGREAAEGGDLARRALEGFALEEFKSRHITRAELRRLLGFETRHELDGFLKAHQVYDEYTQSTPNNSESDNQGLTCYGEITICERE